MAKHRRRFRGITSLKLGFLPNMNRSVQVGDAAIGAAVGIVAAGGVKAALGKFAPSVLSMGGATGQKLMPLLTGVAAGAALYYGQKKSARGFGHAVGASLAGLALTVQAFMRGVNLFGYTFDEVTSVNLGGYNGFLVPDATDGRMAGFGGGHMGGFLVPDTTDQRLNELAAISMGADDDGIAALVG